jgi:hypothetical protein
MTVVWTDTEINGRRCASTTMNNKRFYVVERFGKVEGWIDGVRVGSYADLFEAKAAVLRIWRPVV